MADTDADRRADYVAPPSGGHIWIKTTREVIVGEEDGGYGFPIYETVEAWQCSNCKRHAKREIQGFWNPRWTGNWIVPPACVKAQQFDGGEGDA